MSRARSANDRSVPPGVAGPSPDTSAIGPSFHDAAAPPLEFLAIPLDGGGDPAPEPLPGGLPADAQSGADGLPGRSSGQGPAGELGLPAGELLLEGPGGAERHQRVAVVNHGGQPGHQDLGPV